MHIHGYQLTSQGSRPLNVSASSLDELTSHLSDGFYTTFSTLSGGTRVLGLRAHLDRLYLPAHDLRLQPAVSEEILRQHIAEIVKENLPHESRVRLILTKDTGEIFIGTQTFRSLPEAIYRDGVHVISADLARHDPRIKGTDFIFQSAAQRKMISGDVFEILLTHSGKIFEGMTSNFYAVKYPAMTGQQAKRSQSRDIKLVTAQKGILLGVTRGIVLKLARGQGLSIDYRSPLLDEKFDEAFLTSSSRGVVPIVQIDGRPVGQGKPGAWTKTLSSAYQAYVEKRSESILIPN